MKCCDNCLCLVQYILFYTDRVQTFTSTRRNNKRGDNLLGFFFNSPKQKTRVKFSDKNK